MGIRKKMKKQMRRYGEEAFSAHRESAYAAITVICGCLEFLQNQENHGSRRAIPLKDRIYVLMEQMGLMDICSDPGWEWVLRTEYDSRLRREEYRKLMDALDDPGQCLIEEIPLKNFLKEGLVLVIEDAADPDWTDRMNTLIRADRYTGVRAFQEAVYVMGFLELQKYESGKKYHIFKGDFRDAEHLLRIFRSLIPKGELENYDHFCTELLNDMETKRMEAMTQVLKKREEWLKEAQMASGGIPVLDYFNKKMLEMEDREFREFLTERLTVVDHIEGNEDDKLEGEELREAKAGKVRDLADLFVYGERGIKERFIKSLSWEEQLTVMEWWMSDFYPSGTDQLSDRLSEMCKAGGMDIGEVKDRISYEKMMLDSLGKLAGWAVDRDTPRWLEVYDKYWRTFDRKEQTDELAEDRKWAENCFKDIRSIRSAFHRNYGRMNPERIRRAAGEMGTRTLAAALVLAEEEVRENFFKNLTEHQQGLVIEEWGFRLDKYTMEDMAGAMDKMVVMSGLTGK